MHSASAIKTRIILLLFFLFIAETLIVPSFRIAASPPATPQLLPNDPFASRHHRIDNQKIRFISFTNPDLLQALFAYKNHDIVMLTMV